jgi:hypothetical protein
MKIPDDLSDALKYDTEAFKARLYHHDTTEGFYAALTAVAGGSLNPSHGGDWERMKLASRWLRGQEAPAGAARTATLRRELKELSPVGQRFVDSFGAAAGIELSANSVQLTIGEHAFYSHVITTVAIADADDAFDKICRGFPGAEILAVQSGETAGESAPSPAETSPEIPIVHFVTFPNGKKASEMRCGGCDNWFVAVGVEPSKGRSCPLCGEHADVVPDSLRVRNIEGYSIELAVDVPEAELAGIPSGPAKEILRYVADPRRAFLALVAEARKGKPGKGLIGDLIAMADGYEPPAEWKFEVPA